MSVTTVQVVATQCLLRGKKMDQQMLFVSAVVVAGIIVQLVILNRLWRMLVTLSEAVLWLLKHHPEMPKEIGTDSQEM
jgi:hypothetical protein